MKIIKIISSENGVFNYINSSMSNTETVTTVNLLDACGCTGNGLC